VPHPLSSANIPPIKDELFDGQHKGIIDSKLFEQVQTAMDDNSVQNGTRRRNKHSALLKGLLICKSCNAPFVHTYIVRCRVH
jgi:site-specific DNA recombinase